MKIKETIGIDVSKATLDACIHSSQRSATFENSKKGFVLLVKWAYKGSVHPRTDILFVFEHTGLYSEKLSEHLSEKDIPYTMVPGLEIKRSLGIARGKDDKIDAAKIALYAYRLRDEIKLSATPLKEIKALKKLLSLRERLVRQRAGYRTSIKEQKRVLEYNEAKLLLKVQQSIEKELSKQIDIVENEMQSIIGSNSELTGVFDLLLSVRCIGKQAALFLIVCTEGFSKFKNARQFAAYCGVAPFPNQSGTSLRGRSKVSPLANKKMKSLLDMCAKSSIRYNMEIREYYLKRVAQGKNKMSTINVIRNKLIARVFAVVHRGTPYVDLYRHAS